MQLHGKTRCADLTAPGDVLPIALKLVPKIRTLCGLLFDHRPLPFLPPDC